MDRRHVIGVVLIVVAVLMVTQGVWLQWKRGEELDCQADYNAAVAADRAALNGMIFTLVDPKASQRKKVAAVNDYVVLARKAQRRAGRIDCG